MQGGSAVTEMDGDFAAHEYTVPELCEWCGEPANNEMGKVQSYRAGAKGYVAGYYHAACRVTYYQRVHGQDKLLADLRLRVRRLYMQFEGDLEEVDAGQRPSSEREMLEQFLEYVSFAQADTWFDLTNAPLHGEGEVRL